MVGNFPPIDIGPDAHFTVIGNDRFAFDEIFKFIYRNRRDCLDNDLSAHAELHETNQKMVV